MQLVNDLVPLTVDGTAPALPERAAPRYRLPGDPGTDLFLRLAAGFLASYPSSRRVYSSDLRAWADWCERIGVHPLAAERIHVEAWIEHLTTQLQRATGRLAAPALVARRLSALSAFYDYGIKDAEVLTHSSVGNVRRPGVADESSSVGLSADELSAGSWL